MPRPLKPRLFSLGDAVPAALAVAFGVVIVVGLCLREHHTVGRAVLSLTCVGMLWGCTAAYYLLRRARLAFFRAWAAPGIVLGWTSQSLHPAPTAVEDLAFAVCVRVGEVRLDGIRVCSRAAAQRALKGLVLLFTAPGHPAPRGSHLVALELGDELLVLPWTASVERSLEHALVQRVVRRAMPQLSADRASAFLARYHAKL